MPDIVGRLTRQIERGEQVIAGSYSFEEWRAGSTMLLEQALGEKATLVEDFKKISYSLSAYTSNTPASSFRKARDAGIRKGISHLKVAIEHLQSGPSTYEESLAVDSQLWAEIQDLVSSERWHQVASTTAVFLENAIRTWAGLTGDDFGKNLMIRVFKSDGGRFPCGSTDSEELGWQQLATGFVQAVGNVDRHRIQDRDDAKTYAFGVVGTASLILTQLRHQHGTRFRGSVAEDSATDPTGARS